MPVVRLGGRRTEKRKKIIDSIIILILVAYNNIGKRLCYALCCVMLLTLGKSWLILISLCWRSFPCTYNLQDSFVLRRVLSCTKWGLHPTILPLSRSLGEDYSYHTCYDSPKTLIMPVLGSLDSSRRFSTGFITQVQLDTSNTSI